MITKEQILKVLLIMFVLVSLILLFRLKNNNDNYTTNINKLEHINDSLMNNSDSLKLVNLKLTNDINKINKTVDSVNIVLTNVEVRIKNIKNGKTKIINHLSNLSADSVAIYLTDYIKKRRRN